MPQHTEMYNYHFSDFRLLFFYCWQLTYPHAEKCLGLKSLRVVSCLSFECCWFHTFITFSKFYSSQPMNYFSSSKCISNGSQVKRSHPLVRQSYRGVYICIYGLSVICLIICLLWTCRFGRFALNLRFRVTSRVKRTSIETDDVFLTATNWIATWDRLMTFFCCARRHLSDLGSTRSLFLLGRASAECGALNDGWQIVMATMWVSPFAGLFCLAPDFCATRWPHSCS